MGRASSAALGRIASAKSGLAKAQTNVAQHVASVAEEFVERKERAEFDNAVASSRIDMAQWTEEYGAKQFYTADELEGRVDKSVRLTEADTDDDGKEIQVPRRSIPAYEVYSQLLNNKLNGDMLAKSEGITNPLYRKDFIRSRSVYNADTVRQAGLAGAKEQRIAVRTQSDAKRIEAVKTGDIITADYMAKNFDGSEFEIAERLKENKQGIELWRGAKMIQMESVAGMNALLDDLTQDDYRGSGGALTEDQNINLQNRLRSKLGSMQARSKSGQKVYTAEATQRGNDMVFALENGHPQPVGSVKSMVAELDALGLNRLALQVKRAEKLEPFVTEMFLLPQDQHEGLINDYIGDAATGNEAIKLRAELNTISGNISKQVREDATGVWMNRNMSDAPKPGDDDFFSRTVLESKKASNNFQVNAQPLSDAVAEQFAGQFKNATIKKKTEFITEVLDQVMGKADRDKIFTQIDKKYAGNLNVYADIIERGDNEIINDIDAGKKLREDKTLKLVPEDTDSEINSQLADVFKLNTELRSYREAVKDYYAKMANDNGVREEEYVDEDWVKEAIKTVVGNVVEYDSKNFLLPNNELDADSFEDWINNVDYKYIDQLGGVMGMESKDVLQAIREGDLKLKPSLTRGEYLIADATGEYLMKSKFEAGKSIPFRYIYNRNAPTKRTKSWFEFKSEL